VGEIRIHTVKCVQLTLTKHNYWYHYRTNSLLKLLMQRGNHYKIITRRKTTNDHETHRIRTTSFRDYCSRVTSHV